MSHKGSIRQTSGEWGKLKGSNKKEAARNERRCSAIIIRKELKDASA